MFQRGAQSPHEQPAPGTRQTLADGRAAFNDQWSKDKGPTQVANPRTYQTKSRLLLKLYLTSDVAISTA
jgi:hypothetical protein